MAADPSQVSDAAQNGTPTWQQYEALAIPPPLPQADDATINALEKDAPKPPDLSKIGQPDADQQRALDDLSKMETSDLASLHDDEKAYVEDVRQNQSQQERLTDAEIQTLQEQPPAPPTQTANPMQRMAPLLLMAAFGGKLTKLDAGAMLAATTGTVNGYLAGNQQAYENAQKAYAEAYDRFKDRQEQQLKIFEEMKKAYAGRPDADLKALQAAHDMTGDEIKVSQQLLETQEHMRSAAQQLAKTQYDMDKQSYDERVKLELARKKDAKTSADKPKIDDQGLELEAKLFLRDPTNARFSAPERTQIMNWLGAHGITPDDIVNQRAQTKLDYAEATTLGRQKANLDRVERALTMPGGIGDQAIAAAKELSPSNLKTVNKISQLFQREFSDPKLVKFRIKMLALRDEYATVINRGQAPTEGSRAQATEEMDKYQVNAVPAIVSAITDTATTNNKALDDEISGLGHHGASGSSGSTPKPRDQKTVSAAVLQDYAKKYGLTPEQAKAELAKQNVTVQ